MPYPSIFLSILIRQKKVIRFQHSIKTLKVQKSKSFSRFLHFDFSHLEKTAKEGEDCWETGDSRAIHCEDGLRCAPDREVFCLIPPCPGVCTSIIAIDFYF